MVVYDELDPENDQSDVENRPPAPELELPLSDNYQLKTVISLTKSENPRK